MRSFLLLAAKIGASGLSSHSASSSVFSMSEEISWSASLSSSSVSSGRPRVLGRARPRRTYLARGIKLLALSLTGYRKIGMCKSPKTPYEIVQRHWCGNVSAMAS